MTQHPGLLPLPAAMRTHPRCLCGGSLAAESPAALGRPRRGKPMCAGAGGTASGTHKTRKGWP
eukprot:5236372-Alexandrium_andersonii.AAC.1